MGALDTFDTASKSAETVSLIVDKALHAKWNELAGPQLDQAVAEDEKHGSLGGIPKTTEVVEQMEAIRDQVEASRVLFRFEQLEEWSDYVSLLAEHPPRKEAAVDQFYGANVKTFGPALIRASCVSVQGHDDPEPIPATEVTNEKWERLLRSLNHRQMNDLLVAARKVNEGETQVPPSARSLLEVQDLGASLKQPEPGQGRPRSGSAGGNRPGSPKSKETSKDESSDS